MVQDWISAHPVKKSPVLKINSNVDVYFSYLSANNHNLLYWVTSEYQIWQDGCLSALVKYELGKSECTAFKLNWQAMNLVIFTKYAKLPNEKPSPKFPAIRVQYSNSAPSISHNYAVCVIRVATCTCMYNSVAVCTMLSFTYLY